MTEIGTLVTDQTTQLNKIITGATAAYNELNDQLSTMVEDISSGNVSEITIHLLSSTSAVADNDYNKNLSLRRSHSVLKQILGKISTPDITPEDRWSVDEVPIIYEFKDLGYTGIEGKVIFTTKSEGETYTLQENSRCGEYHFINKTLKVVAPVAYECRQTQVVVIYTKKPQTVLDVPKNTSDSNLRATSKQNDIPSEETNRSRSKPPLDMMKYIIMKTLSECHYFQKLEETDPVVFGSLKEKFKFFHPGFHSMTPEGLNARLTFLNQCVRPGDTIPIKGVNSSLDLRARNTSFGPPPICVLRVGDFYHSKVIVRDVNINFEESPWDLNPEGIGIQPMIASVQMQISFIGGQGLEKPVNWLQNALTSNFYANTEMYDPRSIPTNQFIGGETREKFTKEFINSLMSDTEKKPDYIEPDTSDKITTGHYIGELVNTALNYRAAVESVFVATNKYISGYDGFYNNIVLIYGKNVSSILLSPNYRKNNKYNVYTVTNGSPTPIDLFGIYEKGRDLFILTSMFENKLNDTLSTIDILKMFNFDKEIPTNKVSTATRFVKEYLSTFIQDTIDKMNTDTNLKSIEDSRNELISSLDKVNFVVKYGYDAKLNENKNDASQGQLSGFTYPDLYNDYSSCIDYITKNSTQFYESLDNSINYSSTIESLTDDEFSNIMADLLSIISSNEFISKTFGRDTTIFDMKLTQKLTTRYEKFINKTDVKKFKFSKFKERARDIDLMYEIITPEPIITDSNIINELISMNKTPNIPINELNYYRV
jgi:hypothetical protein